MPADDPEQLLASQAAERARVLLESLSRDAQALRESASELAEGAELCDDVADALREILSHLQETHEES